MNLKILNKSTEERRDLILNGSITKTILLLSIPALMFGVVQSLMPVIDGLFINNVIGTTTAGAISYSSPIINMITALAQGLSVAASAIIGQSNGRGNFQNSKKISTQIIVFAFLLGCVLAPILAILAYPVSKGVSTEMSKTVFTYLSLSSLVLPFSFLESIYNSIKNANGKPEATFIRMIIMLILKVIFNSIFILVFNLGIVGAVLASLASNIIISIWMFYELFVFEGDDKLSLKDFSFKINIIKSLLRIGIPSMISSLMVNLGFFLINREVVKFGDTVLSAQAIASNVSSLCFNIPAAFSLAITTMVSMNIGSGNENKAKKSCLVGCIVSSIASVIIIIIMIPLAPYLTVLFTRDPEVLAITNSSLNIYIFSILGFGICMIQQGAFIGLGRTRIPLITNLLRFWLLRYLFILLTEKYLGYYSVFYGNLFSNYLTAIISTVIIFKIQWKSGIKSS